MVLLVGSVGILSCPAAAEQRVAPGAELSGDVYPGWRLGMQSWTFHHYTFYDAVDKTAELGLKRIEAYHGHRLSREIPGVRFHYTMPAEIREKIKRKLDSAGVKLVSYYVWDLPNECELWRPVFEFAKDMGIETIVSEPPLEALDLIESLCKRYKVRLAIHNHPKGSPYWHPDKVLAACKGRSRWIGACADTGHWIRAGLDVVEALKKLEGRIITVHLKQAGLGEVGTISEFVFYEPQEMVWGPTRGCIKEILAELKRQNFKGVFSIEYEHNWEKSLPEMRQCIEYFNKVAGELWAPQPSQPAGADWQLGMQAYTLRHFTFFEAVDKTAALGLDCIEAFPALGMYVSEDIPVLFYHNLMSAEIRRQIKQKLKEAGVKLVSYGAMGLSEDEAQCREVFDFAKDVGATIITSEPAPEALDLIERLCKEYGIKVAIHNHPTPSGYYWSSEMIMEHLKGRSNWIGACADIGHWMEVGLDPVEELRKLEGRVISLHFRDMNEFARYDAHDVVWGTGKADVAAMLAELDRQNFKGVFLIEYGYNPANPMPDVSKCIEYFDRVAAELGHRRCRHSAER